MNFHRQLFKHTIVGCSGAITNISIMYFMTDLLGVHYLLSAFFAFFISTVNTFMLNKIWTYKHLWTYKHWRGSYGKQSLRYFFISFMGLIINMTLLPILVEFLGLWYLMAQMVTIIQLGLFSFLVNKYWVFCPMPLNRKRKRYKRRNRVKRKR